MRTVAFGLGLGLVALAMACSSSDDEDMHGRLAGGGPGGGAGGGAIGNANGASVLIGDDCAAISQGTNNTLQPADIIWAIDNSCSMGDEIIAVRESMNAFSRQITSSGIDAHIVLISDTYAPDVTSMASMGGSFGICIDAPLGSGNCPEDTLQPNYFHVPQMVGSNDALDQIINTHPQWAGQMRPHATKSFVVVTDDNATGLLDFGGLLGGGGGGNGGNDTADGFSANLNALDPNFEGFTFHGIYSFTACPEAAAVGQVYADLVQKTAGVAGDLCLQQFQPVFDQIAAGVIGNSSIDCEWAIPVPPGDEQLIKGAVNVQYTTPGGATENIYHVENASACGAGDGWFYDVPGDNPSKVLVCPSTCTRIQGAGGGALDVLFGCGTVERPE